MVALALRHAPLAPSTPAAQLRLACSARCSADENLCCPQPQLLQRSATTNSLRLPNPASLATRPIPPHSDPLALPIHIYEPSTLRHAPDIKPSYKHHVKLQNRSIFHPKSGANIAVTLNVPRQSFSFPGETMVSDPSSGAAGSFRVKLRRAASPRVEPRQARSSKAKLRRASVHDRRSLRLEPTQEAARLEVQAQQGRRGQTKATVQVPCRS